MEADDEVINLDDSIDNQDWIKQSDPQATKLDRALSEKLERDYRGSLPGMIDIPSVRHGL